LAFKLIQTSKQLKKILSKILEDRLMTK
jgi:hypothetical protein